MINATDSKGTFYKLNQKKGIPIVFIHGVGLDHNIWDPQINEFDNTVLIYDILGHGRTPLNKEKISFDDFSDQIIDLIDELKFDKIHLVGFSIGSLIARNFATRFGNKFRDAVGGTSYLSFTNTRGPAGSKISIPMMHKTDSGLRPYYLTHEFTIHDAPFDDEIVIAIGGASTGRAHARTGDRYQDMKEMGIEPK